MGNKKTIALSLFIAIGIPAPTFCILDCLMKCFLGFGNKSDEQKTRERKRSNSIKRITRELQEFRDLAKKSENQKTKTKKIN